jgi:hypothetical protein
LYRVARKHAGGAGGEGFAISLPILYEKSGAEGTYRRFKFEIAKIVRENDLPGFALALEAGASDPLLRMTRREMVVTEPQTAMRGASPTKKRPARTAEPAQQLPLLRAHLADDMLARIRREFPGWDVYALKAEFDSWLHDDPERAPDNYGSAFYGFVKQYHARNRHMLG